MATLLQKIFDDLINTGVIIGFILFVVAGLLSQMKGRNISIKDCIEWLKEKLTFDQEVK